MVEETYGSMHNDGNSIIVHAPIWLKEVTTSITAITQPFRSVEVYAPFIHLPTPASCFALMHVTLSSFDEPMHAGVELIIYIHSRAHDDIIFIVPLQSR